MYDLGLEFSRLSSWLKSYPVPVPWYCSKHWVTVALIRSTVKLPWVGSWLKIWLSAVLALPANCCVIGRTCLGPVQTLPQSIWLTIGINFTVKKVTFMLIIGKRLCPNDRAVCCPFSSRELLHSPWLLQFQSPTVLA